MQVSRYTIKRSLAKVNIKHSMPYNKPVAYKKDAYQVFPGHF